ncbi:MAG TPA: protein translocase subunit SecF [Terriglobia bacterium]|nr:protein translocase subunit SecF [Terriglobia bacterium]
MEFFHEPKIDWMGIKWYLIALSLALASAGIISMVVKKGLAYGIDFRGGTEITVKFAKAPNLDAIRSELDRQNVRGETITSIGAPSDHEVIIGLDLKTTASSQALDEGKGAIVTALSGLFGSGQPGKLDFNNSSPQTVSEHLLAADPLGLASKGFDAASKSYRDLADALINFRNSPPRVGLISDFQELSSVPGVNAGVIATLKNDFFLSSFAIGHSVIVGPKVGKDLRQQALYVTLAGLGAMLVYIWFRFELSYGVAAVVATFHDVTITLGFFSLLNKEITLTVIAALLTLVGYSMNDTIVVFDRIRENARLNKRENFVDLVNRSINQTLSRTILTSGLTFIAVLSLFLFGGEVIHGFSFTLVVGVIVGTYSSIFIASPIVVYFHKRLAGSAAVVKSKSYSREAVGARR